MFYTLFTQPLLNLLAFFVWLVPSHDLGLAIVLLTVTVRLLLWPFQAFSQRSQEAFRKIQPRLEEIKKKYADSRDKQLAATLALYREQRVNPLAMTGGSVLLLALQLPILFALFRILSNDITQKIISGLYAFTPAPAEVSTRLLGVLELAEPSILLAVAAGGAQFFQMRFSRQTLTGGASGSTFGVALQKQMLYVFPVLTVVIALRLPAALALYWLAFTLLAVSSDVWNLIRRKSSSTPVSPPSADSSA